MDELSKASQSLEWLQSWTCGVGNSWWCLLVDLCTLKSQAPSVSSLERQISSSVCCYCIYSFPDCFVLIYLMFLIFDMVVNLTACVEIIMMCPPSSTTDLTQIQVLWFLMVWSHMVHPLTFAYDKVSWALPLVVSRRSTSCIHGPSTGKRYCAKIESDEPKVMGDSESSWMKDSQSIAMSQELWPLFCLCTPKPCVC